MRGCPAANPPAARNTRVGGRRALRVGGGALLTCVLPMPTFPPHGLIAEFCDELVAHDLPDLPAERRADVVAFAGRRIDGLPSPMRLGRRRRRRRRRRGVAARRWAAHRRRPRPPPAPRCSASTSASSARSPTPTSGRRGRTPRAAAARVGATQRRDAATTGLACRGADHRLRRGGAPTAALLAEAGFDVLVRRGGPARAPGRRRAVLARPDGPAVPRRRRDGGARLPDDRLHRGLLRRRWHGGQQRAVPPPARGGPRRAGATTTGSSTSTPPTSTPSATRSSTSCPCSPSPAPTRPPARPCAAARPGLGWRHDEIPRWMTYPDGTDATSGRRRSMTETYLPRATAAGARLLTGHPRRPPRARWPAGDPRRDHDGRRAARHRRLRPRRSSAGGAIQTPALLQRSGLRHNIGRSLAVHPTVKLTARFPDEVNVRDDVPVHQVKEFAPDLSFGGSASGPGLAALALSDSWNRFGPAIEDWRRLAVYYAAITSEGRGAVRAVPGLRDPVVTYRLTRRDRALLGRGLARLALLMLEAGATDVFPSYRGAPIVRRRADLATMQATFARRPSERDDRPPVLHGAAGRGPARRDRLPRPRPRHDATSASTTPRCCPTPRASIRRLR